MSYCTALFIMIMADFFLLFHKHICKSIYVKVLDKTWNMICVSVYILKGSDVCNVEQ